MIKNDKQLATAERRIEELNACLAGAELQADRETFEALLEETLTEVREYRSVKEHRTVRFSLSNLDDIAKALIHARLSRGWTQKQLAEALGVLEQSVLCLASRPSKRSSKGTTRTSNCSL